MADMRDLWWAAGRMAFSVAENDDWRNSRWSEALRRSATLLEPVWPKAYSSGPFSQALPTIALFLYSQQLSDEPEHVPVEEITEALARRRDAEDESSLEDVIRDGLVRRHHDLGDDSQLSVLFRWLAEYRPPLTHSSDGFELSSSDHWPGGTLMGAAAAWATHVFNHHYLGRSSA
ncbi:hypothetical protein ABZ410_15875 [Streptomyces cinnamoneus]|uniref:hypothetical protein n=1 Tax=Streptomyces cinnamoneus TaxID=53446 RepID=UPI0033CA3599